jgi:hypothetical protein
MRILAAMLRVFQQPANATFGLEMGGKSLRIEQLIPLTIEAQHLQ